MKILMLLGLIAVGLSAQEPISMNLAGAAYTPLLDWWFDDGSGTTVTDHSGANNNGTFSAGSQAPTWNSDGSGITVNGGQSVIIPTAVWASHRTMIIAYKPNVTLESARANNIATIAASNQNSLIYDINPYTLMPSISAAAVYGNAGNLKSAGNTITVFVLSNPNVYYQFTQPMSGYTGQGTATSAPSSNTTVLLGDYGGAPNGGYGFPGQIFHFALYPGALTNAQIAYEVQRIRAIQGRKGVTFNDSPDVATTQLILAGDSIAYGTGPGTPAQSWPQLMLSYLPETVSLNNLALPGANWNGVAGGVTSIVSLANKFDDALTVCAVHAGTNDIGTGGNTATQVYSTAKSWLASVAGCKATVIGTLIARASYDSTIDTLNACIQAGFLGTNSGCGGGQLAATAVSWWGFDPNMKDNETSNWYNGLHPTAAGSSMGAAYWGVALTRALGKWRTPVNVSIRLSNNSNTSWTLSFDSGVTTGAGPAIAAATSQSIPVFYLGPKQINCGDVTLKSSTQFSATGLTTLQATIGDSASSTPTFYTSTQYNMMTAPGVTNIQHNNVNTGPSWAGSNVTIELNGANQNLNAQTNLAGAVDISLPVCSIP